jgi:hypothetical protein
MKTNATANRILNTPIWYSEWYNKPASIKPGINKPKNQNHQLDIKKDYKYWIRYGWVNVDDVDDETKSLNDIQEKENQKIEVFNKDERKLYVKAIKQYPTDIEFDANKLDENAGYYIMSKGINNNEYLPTDIMDYLKENKVEDVEDDLKMSVEDDDENTHVNLIAIKEHEPLRKEKEMEAINENAEQKEYDEYFQPSDENKNDYTLLQSIISNTYVNDYIHIHHPKQRNDLIPLITGRHLEIKQAPTFFSAP